jgi:hypothetical protein
MKLRRNPVSQLVQVSPCSDQGDDGKQVWDID